MRDPCDPIRDFKERMSALFSNDNSSDFNDKYDKSESGK